MSRASKVLVGGGGGVAWGIAVLWVGSTQLEIPIFTRPLIVPFFFLAPGLVILAMVAALGLRRFWDDDLDYGAPPYPGSATETDQRVLRDTIEQAVLALCLWTPISFLLPETGLGIVICLSISFAIARLLFWVGFHISPLLRTLGFTATLFPTILAMIWAGIWWATM